MDNFRQYWKPEPAIKPWNVEFFGTWAMIAAIETLRCTLHIQVLGQVKRWLSEKPVQAMQGFVIHWLLCTLLYWIFSETGMINVDKTVSQLSDSAPGSFDGMSQQVIFFALGFYTTLVVIFIYLAIVSLIDSFTSLMWGEGEEEKGRIWNLVSCVAILATVYAFFAAHHGSRHWRQQYYYQQQQQKYYF